MKAISVQQPWAYSILRLGKDVENRGNRRGMEAAAAYWRNAVGALLIHTSQRLTPDYRGALHDIERITGGPLRDDMAGPDPATHLGAVVGAVRVRSVHTSDDCQGACSPWSQFGVAHLVVAEARVLAHPIQHHGRLGLWTVDDDLVLAQIRRELA